MIFKTINSSVDETKKTLALFNKDWNTYKRNWQNANSVFGKIGSIFAPAISKNDIEAIKAYNSQIDSGVTSQTAFNRTMLDASSTAQNLVASYNGGKVSVQGMAAAQNVAEVSTIGLSIAQTALNAAIGMGASLLVSLIVKGINKLIHANEEAIEKAEKLREKYEEFRSSNESNITTLKGLEKEFKGLSKGVSQYGDNISLTTEQYERYKELIQQIVSMSPSLAEGYSTENGYIADKNGLLERAIELQEQEYRNELRKITNLDNLKTSMSGYIAEYKEAFNGGLVTDDMSAISTTTATDFSNALYDAFNVSDRDDYNSENLARDILKSLGIDDIEQEMQKFFNENGYYQANWFFKEYADEIAKNINAITNALSYENVELDEEEFKNRILTVKDCAQAYLDMKDSISMANESIQRDLQYIAEYSDGYSDLTTEQQKFVNEFLKSFNIDDIVSRNWLGILTYDEDKMISVKRQITDFVETLSQDETTKSALTNLYAIPTDEQSISEFVIQFRNALEVIQTYCQENGIEVPVAISDREQVINDLEAQYQRAVDFAKDKFNGYDPTDFFKEHSINTQEEIDAWLEIAQGTEDAIEAETEYIQNLSPTLDPTSLSAQLTTSQESLDNFQSSVKSASDAYSTLLSGSYSSSELLDSIQAINQAVSSMGGSLNWEFIDSQSNSLEVLGNAIEYVSEQYADSILSGAGIDPDSDFGKILAENIIQAQKAATQLEAVNEQIDSLQEAYQNLTDAVDTYNQCGHITFDQLQNLLSMEPQYLACLTDENGQLQLNRQAMQNLADRRLYDAKVQAVQQAISELGTLTHHDEQKAITDSAQAFRDSVEDVSAYNMELAKTLTEAGIAAPLIRDLGAALNGAEERGASDVDIQTVINNLNAKMKLIGSVDIGNLSGASSSAVSQAETDWKSLLDKETDLLEKQLAANLITFQAYINKRRQVIKNYYLDGKITAEEYYDALESMYGSQLSLYDKAVNAVTGRIDDEIDQLNEQKEAIENSYQVKIDAIQEEIDALNKANDARKAQIDLEKAQYEAERARNQRINKVYDGSQFVYAADVEAVRDAEENLADQKTQINISRLEAQIESLEREMENATKGLDSQIEALESYKEKWNDISGIYEEQQSKLIVAEILGADWESQVLNGRLDTLRSFTEQYIALQQAQADAAANAARIKAESAAGNATGGNVGTVPAAQDLWQTGDGNVDYKHFNRDVTQIYASMAHFHGGLDEGYATAPGQSTPANRSLALLQKLAGENLLPNELPAILRHGELVITPEQQRNIIANTQRYCSLSSANSGYASSYSGEASQIHIDSLTISCPNVTNNSGAEYILKSLERLPLDNIQHSHRRRY